MKLKPIAYSLALAGLACSFNVHAASVSFWTGAASSDLGTATNWDAAPATNTNATLVFDSTVANAGAGLLVPTNAIPAPIYNKLQFNNGGFNLGGSEIALKPYSEGTSYYTEVLLNQAGNNIISAPLSINPNTANRTLGQEGLNNAQITVSGGSLTLGGTVSASMMNLSTSLGSAATLSMNGVSALSFLANGGTQNLTGVLESKTVDLRNTNFTVSGADGAIRSKDSGGTVFVGGDYSTATLTLDNTSHASNKRLKTDTSIIVGSGSTLLLKGHATDNVEQSAGSLRVNGTDYGLTHIKVEGAGANASLAFSSLTSSGLVNFASNGALGNKEKITFTAAPALTDGLMSKALVNGREFAAYDSARGVVAATTKSTLSGAVATDHVYISAAENATGNATINSLAVNNAAITGAHTLSLTSGRLLTSGTVSITPAINFGAKAGEMINLGNTVLVGGVNGTNGLSVLGNGQLELRGAGNLSGNFSHTGQLVLRANNALQGANVTSHSGLDIGSTTQNFNSFSGSNVTGTGTGIVAANNISLNQNVVNVGLRASQNINLTHGFTEVNGVISGAADVVVYNGLFTRENTYTGATATTGYLRLEGNGSIADSSSFSGSLGMMATFGNGMLDRIGDRAEVRLGQSGMLSLRGQGTTMHEDIGRLYVNGAARLDISNNNMGQITSLRADSLELAIGGSLLMSANDFNTSFYVDAAPGLYSGTNVVKNVYVEKDIDGSGKKLPSWAAYDASNGRIFEALVDAKYLSAAGNTEFVRVTDTTNQALGANRTVGAVNIDTIQTMSGSGTLTVGTGQLLFWQNNTINIAGLHFGAQGVVTNAGTNTIASNISGSKGMIKNGDGTLVLTGINTYGDTQVAQGGLTIGSGGSIGSVAVADGAQLLVNNGGSIGTITNNSGNVSIGSYSNASGNTVAGNGTMYVVTMDNHGRIDGVVSSSGTLTNTGTIGRVHNYGTLTNTGTGYISDMSQNSSAVAFVNQGAVGTLSNSGTVTNEGTIRFLANGGTATNSSVATVNGLLNSGNFTNEGTLILDGASLGGTVKNKATAILHAGSSASGDGYTQTAGLTSIDGTFTGNMVLTGGYLNGTGKIFGNVTVGDGAHILPGHSPGLLEVDGDVTFDSGATLEMEVVNDNGTLRYDQLIVTGLFTNNGQLKINLGSGVDFSEDAFTSGGQTITVANLFSKGLLASMVGDDLLVTDALGGTHILAVTSDMLPPDPTSTAPVPVPGAAWLLGSGLLGLLGLARRKAKVM